MTESRPSLVAPADARREQRRIIRACCTGAPPQQIFSNGILLLYLNAIGMGSVGIMLCLSIAQAGLMLFLLPSAYLADRWGKKALGRVGFITILVAFAGISASALLPHGAARLAVILAIMLYSVGITLHTSGWFAIMTPFIPEPERPRFFGLMRFSWQSLSALLGLGFSALLAYAASSWVFAGIFAFLTVLYLASFLDYLSIPEVEVDKNDGRTFWVVLLEIARTDRYLSFCAYAFLLGLFTAGCPVLFGLVEKVTLGLPDGAVSLLANLRLIGAILGFIAGGKAVSRWGTKSVFLVCHFGFGVAIVLFLFRGLTGLPVAMTVAAAEILFGCIAAASSVAFTTEMMLLIPREHKSLSTSLFMTLSGGGAALSGLLSAWALQLGLFSAHWTLFGLAMSSYDAVLTVCGTLVVVIVVTLGLVPSVVGRVQWGPRDPSQG